MCHYECSQHIRVCLPVCFEQERERECVSVFEPTHTVSVFTLTGTNWSKPITPFYFISSELLIHVSVTMLPSTPTPAKLA